MNKAMQMSIFSGFFMGNISLCSGPTQGWCSVYWFLQELKEQIKVMNTQTIKMEIINLLDTSD